MTKIDKPLTRETHATVKHKGKDRAVVVTIDRTTISLRLKGVRKREVVLNLHRLFNEQEFSAARKRAGI
jgi:hypothetical protein